MSNNLVSKKFLKIYDHTNHVDLYNSVKFSKYYEERVNGKKDFYNDITYYKNALPNNSKILEIGTGTGRVLVPLRKANKKIYGIEPAKEMRKFIPKNFQQYTYPLGIDQITSFSEENMKFSHIIIPATSISVFSHDIFEKFLDDSYELLQKNGEIHLDFIKPEYFEHLDNQIMTVRTNDTKYLMTNFLIDNKVIFNITDKTDFAIGIKYIYSVNYLKYVSSKLNFDFKIQKNEADYLMIKLVKK